MRLVFCLPGNKYSKEFLENWTDTIIYFKRMGVEITLSVKYSCNIYYSRNMCLGGDVLRGVNQKPFNSRVIYDFLVWIDSDIIFKPQQIMKLIYHNKHIISGLYLMEDRKHYATVKTWDEKHFLKHGSFQFLKPQDIRYNKDIMEVCYTGMGFMVVKYGVFEDMNYPWFEPIFKEIGNCRDFTMEDVSFCLKASKLGYKILIDPTVIVGHQKQSIII